MKLLVSTVFIFISVLLFSQVTWQSLDAGTEFSVGIKSDGTLWTWGNNLNNELGTGDNDPRETPTQIGTDTDWEAVACGAFHVIALKTDGTLWGWGLNSVFQLGNGGTNNVTQPTQIGDDNDWNFIAAGYAHNHGIKTDGTLWGWGWNFYGQIGDNTTTEVQTPTQISTDTDWAKLSSGIVHSMALKTDGTLWTAGTNLTGQLGIDGLDESYEFIQVGSMNWLDISCGHEFSSGIQSNSTLWSWGFNGNGQLGLGSNNQVDEPTQVGADEDWDKVSCGSSSNFAVKSSGELFATGFNQFGTLGDGTGVDKNSFVYITDDVFNIWAAKGATESGSVFGHHALLLKNGSMNVICATGANYAYQLGNGNQGNNMSFECEVGDTEQTNSITENQKNKLSIYPNPTSDIITLSYSDSNIAIFKLLNSSGQIVLEKKVQNHENISLKDFESGIYFYELMDFQGSVSKGKIVRY